MIRAKNSIWIEPGRYEKKHIGSGKGVTNAKSVPGKVMANHRTHQFHSPWNPYKPLHDTSNKILD
jgi:hypothetical protein